MTIDFILDAHSLERVKTASMEKDSARVLGKNKLLFET